MNASQALISRRGSLMSAAQVGGLRKHPFGRVDQLEDRYLGMVEAPSSNLGTSTSSLHIDGYEVNVRHGFRRYNEVKPLARHVHQTRFSPDLVDIAMPVSWPNVAGIGSARPPETIDDRSGGRAWHRPSLRSRPQPRHVHQTRLGAMFITHLVQFV